jgi:hypothetical protein
MKYVPNVHVGHAQANRHKFDEMLCGINYHSLDTCLCYLFS